MHLGIFGCQIRAAGCVMNVSPSSQSLIEGITAGSVAEFFVPSAQLTQSQSLLMNPGMTMKKGRCGFNMGIKFYCLYEPG